MVKFIFFLLFSFSFLSTVFCQQRDLEDLNARSEYLNRPRFDTLGGNFVKDSLKRQHYTLNIAELADRDVEHRKSESVLIFGARSSYGAYCGKIPNAIYLLYNGWPIERIKVKGKVPDKYIYFDYVRPWKDTKPLNLHSRGDNNTDLVKEIDSFGSLAILSFLQAKYHFTVKDTNEITEIWRIRIADTVKLMTYLRNNNPTGSPVIMNGESRIDTIGSKHYYSSIGLILNLYYKMEYVTRRIIYNETVEFHPKWFELRHIEEIENFGNYDKMKVALERFGIGLYKENKLESFKLIEFHDP
jgi:hypothetical protein